MWRGGGAFGQWRYKLVGGPGACSPGKISEFLDCLGLHFARFHGGERECTVVQRKSKPQELDLLKIKQNNGCMVSQFVIYVACAKQHIALPNMGHCICALYLTSCFNGVLFDCNQPQKRI